METAAELLDFRGRGGISEHAAYEQLRGAVALHNILVDRSVAYLADEVGMGKTYVALGALALFRHFDPSFRVLVIAPRENIQKKWIKETRNFAENNVRFSDLRVRSLQGTPARASISCGSVVELVRETAADPDRDFYARMTSFSLPLGKDVETWKEKRNQLMEHLPWLDKELFDLRNRDVFKENFARALNCGLPVFDLVIFDEGHNLKSGRKKDGASRNRVLSIAFGHPSERDARHAGFPGYAKRATRVLFLSATPLENDYAQLWNQLDIFGFGGTVEILRNPNAADEDKRKCARDFLIRRVTTLPAAGELLTKNLYRREWRAGGVATHDEALLIPGEKQRLTVALVQKKVSEIIGHAKFQNRFQIGMLASFESFLQTAKVREKEQGADEVGTFDDLEQTERLEERLGVDVRSVNHLVRHYRKRFGSEMPHPKMDEVVARLADAFETGEKALVFVRRVASVNELQRKVEERYDDYLFARLRMELKAILQGDLEAAITQYRADRTASDQRRGEARRVVALSNDDVWDDDAALDEDGSTESFFAWFFRGEGPGRGILSGAVLRRRFGNDSTFFEDNHVAWILGVSPGGVTDALVKYLGRSRDDLAIELSQLASTRLTRAKRQERRNIFKAFQGAACELLSAQPGQHRTIATIVKEERYATGRILRRGAPPPDLGDWLEIDTLWTALRARPKLRNALWSESSSPDARESFRMNELRRELFSAMAKFGHPFIDLYVEVVNRLHSLRIGARERAHESGVDLAAAFLARLESQSDQRSHTSYREFAEASKNFDLIVAVNDPDIRKMPLAEASRRFGQVLLRGQQPVGGMFGQVNETLIKQFRMPGYPLVLITTDLLQEGEDLHTFCSSVYHYGISWMPSSMEQRVGRVDRVSSQTDRRLTELEISPKGEQLLQVYYPHLRETIEVLQVDRVLERLNRFVRLMHEGFGVQGSEDRSVNVSTEVLRTVRDLAPVHESLKTAFPVREEFLKAAPRQLAVDKGEIARFQTRFRALPNALAHAPIEWERPFGDASLFGTMMLGTRKQPFALLFRSVFGRPAIRCVSPVGVLADTTDVRVRDAARRSGVRIGAVYDDSFQSYNLTVEGDVLFGDPIADVERAGWLLRQVASVADQLEKAILERDEPMIAFRSDLEREVEYER